MQRLDYRMFLVFVPVLIDAVNSLYFARRILFLVYLCSTFDEWSK